MVAGIVAFISTRPGIAPAGPAVLVVNSVSNSSDGDCDSTDCTLREAIEDVNAGPADTIMFDPSVFPPATPGVIDIEGGDGPQPTITADVTIDASNAGVVIDGNANDDGTAVGPALTVHGSHAGFTFELSGEGRFTIQDIDGPGIDVDGQTFAAAELAFDSIEIADTTGDGIFIHNLSYSSDVSLTNSTISSGNNGIRAVMAGPNIQDVGFIVSGSDIVAANAADAGGAAVTFNMQTGLAPSAAVDFIVEDNTRLRSHGDNGVNLAYCSSGTPCVLDHSQINASISGNTEVRSSGDGIHMRLNADPDAPGSVGSSISLHMDDNAEITADSDAIDIVSHLCCGSDNQQTITIDGNGPISTLPDGSDAVDVEAGACCSPGSGVTVDISDNTGGISANEGNAVQLLLVCCGDNSVDIHDNGPITSADDNGIHILNCVEDEFDPNGEEADCIADSTTLLNITGNTLSASTEDGMHICCGEFQRGDERSVISGNTVTANERDGIEIDSSHGITVGPGNVVTGNGTSGDSDNNGVEIGNFVSILIFAHFAVEVPADGNTITHNEIQGNNGLGIDLVGFALTGNPQNPGPAYLEYAVVGCNPYPPVSSNDCLASPVLSGVTSETLEGQSCAGCLIEVFLANAVPPDQPEEPADPQYGEGASYLASRVANGAGDFSVDLPCGLSAGQLTATATDDNGSTSEFSANLAFSGTSSVDCTPTPTATGSTPQPATPTATQTPPPTPTTTVPPPITPSRTPTPTHTATPTDVTGLCGDVDGSGSVNSIDAALVLQYSAGLIQTLTNPEGADVNSDGDINSIDAALILQHTAGLLLTLTC